MNSVHEPGSRTMSKNRLRNNTESIRIENRLSALSAQPKASPHAQAARLPPVRPARLPPSRPAPTPQRLLAPAARPCRTPAPPARACCAQRLPSAHAPCHNTILYCDTIWPSLSCNTPQPTKLYCNTVS